MKKIGSILDKTIKKLGVSSQLRHYKVIEVWDMAVGKQVSDIAQPYDIKYKTLFVAVRDPVWMRQLKFLEEMIKEKINTEMGKRAVDKIFFRIGDLKQREAFRNKI